MSAIDLLESQHREVEKLFQKIEKASKGEEKIRLFEEIADKLAIHAAIEEHHFYPAVKEKRTEDILLESVEEHLAIKRTIADLLKLDVGDVQFDGRKVLYTWIGGTRRDWRAQGHFRALTEQQELWAIGQGFDEIVVKTKNKFYEMRGTLDHLRFEVVKYERRAGDNAESKVYLSKKLLPDVVEKHRSAKTVVQIPV